MLNSIIHLESNMDFSDMEKFLSLEISDSEIDFHKFKSEDKTALYINLCTIQVNLKRMIALKKIKTLADSEEADIKMFQYIKENNECIKKLQPHLYQSGNQSEFFFNGRPISSETLFEIIGGEVETFINNPYEQDYLKTNLYFHDNKLTHEQGYFRLTIDWKISLQTYMVSMKTINDMLLYQYNTLLGLQK